VRNPIPDSSITAVPAGHSGDHRASELTQEKTRDPGFSRIRFCLQTADRAKRRDKSPKVSGPVRENSRFEEIFGGDRFEHD
jgi:hypothetical protein